MNRKDHAFVESGLAWAKNTAIFFVIAIVAWASPAYSAPGAGGKMDASSIGAFVSGYVSSPIRCMSAFGGLDLGTLTASHPVTLALGSQTLQGQMQFGGDTLTSIAIQPAGPVTPVGGLSSLKNFPATLTIADSAGSYSISISFQSTGTTIASCQSTGPGVSDFITVYGNLVAPSGGVTLAFCPASYRLVGCSVRGYTSDGDSFVYAQNINYLNGGSGVSDYSIAGPLASGYNDGTATIPGGGGNKVTGTSGHYQYACGASGCQYDLEIATDSVIYGPTGCSAYNIDHSDSEQIVATCSL